MPNVDIPQGMDTSGSPRHQDTMGGTSAQTRSKRVLAQPNEPPLTKSHTSRSGEGRMEHIAELMDTVPFTPYDSPLTGGYTPGSDEGRLKLKELIDLCTTLSNKIWISSSTRKLKKQKLDQQTEEKKEEIEAQDDNDQEVEEMKLYIRIFPNEDMAIDAIPLATKTLVNVEYKIVKEEKISTYHIIRADGSTKRYTLMINFLKNIDREDLEALWKLVKNKHMNTRSEKGYERVLWGDLKVTFEPDIESKVWRQLQGYDVTVWKLFSSSRVHIVRFKNLHIFMLVDKVYPLTPATITKMLERKIQADQWNEIGYQLHKIMLKQQRKR
nr:hypothetical protein [Tanacetum cinerariifolium]